MCYVLKNPTANFWGQGGLIFKCLLQHYFGNHYVLNWVSLNFRYVVSDNNIQKASSLPFHICEYIGGPNLALNRPASSPNELYKTNLNYSLEYVTDGIFPLQHKVWFNIWHGLGLWNYLEIKLGGFYPVKTIIFQTRYTT